MEHDIRHHSYFASPPPLIEAEAAKQPAQVVVKDASEVEELGLPPDMAAALHRPTIGLISIYQKIIDKKKIGKITREGILGAHQPKAPKGRRGQRPIVGRTA